LSEKETYIKVFVGLDESLHSRATINATETNIEISRKDIQEKDKFFIVNNAGGYEDEPNSPGDRGLGEIDSSLYNEKELIPFFCGCSVAIKRDALFGENLFYDEFIAYFEDSELSKRITRRGYHILYVPQSLVYHKHSASNVEKSAFWRTYTFRNKYLFLFILSRNENRKKIMLDFINSLMHLKNFYETVADISPEENGFLNNVPLIAESADLFFRNFSKNNSILRKNRIGVFNRHWSTMGGGEAHAIHIANAIAKEQTIDIICVNDIPLEKICAYFGVDRSRFRKKLVKNFNSSVTKEYDIFINASYQDQTISHAKKSFYVVSFPSRHDNSFDFLKSYYFLANSKYTFSWMRKYWSDVSFLGDVVYPYVSDAFHADMRKKKKIILSVGRFASSGHTKCQLEIAQSYNAAVRKHNRNTEWELVLIGSVNDNAYLQKVYDALGETRYRIIEDADFDQVVDLYKDASIYVHASGMYMDEDNNPELFEHFGMTVAQSFCAGCFPIVYGAAGPKEIVNAVGSGMLYNDADELSNIFENVFKCIDDSYTLGEEKTKLSQMMFSSLNTENKVSKIISHMDSNFGAVFTQ